MAKCKEEVQDKVGFGHFYRCTRNEWKDGYCKQHHPDTVKASISGEVSGYAELLAEIIQEGRSGGWIEGSTLDIKVCALLEPYKAGMLEAARIAENTGLDGSAVLWGREMIRKAITAAAEKI